MLHDISEEGTMVERKRPPVYYVLFCVMKYKDIEEAKSKDPDTIAKHLASSRELHRSGNPIMAGAFLNNPEGPLTTMGVFSSNEAAEQYAKSDPFVLKGMVSKRYIPEWANALD
jgi:uncharacterized protein YciI